MTLLTNIELRSDPLAREYFKIEEVTVSFAASNGEIASREGANRFSPGDALITGSTGDRWSVSRERFDAKYEPIPPLTHGENGRYKSKRIPVLAKQVGAAFSLERSRGGDVIHGNAGDWLMQYAPDDFGIVAGAKFSKVYRER